MKDSIIPTAISAPHVARPTILTRLARHAVLSQFRKIHHGEITLIENEERHTFGAQTEVCPLAVTMQVFDPRVYLDTALSGSVGAGEAYMSGLWSCDDLTALIRIFVRNREVLDDMEAGLARVTVPLRKFFHFLRRNSKEGSRHNIAAHYDLGNEFFALFLDETMTYSCGIFAHENSTLRDASIAKIDRICQKLQVSPNDHLLEIGTGWGAFAVHAAQQYGCHVTTTTVSQEQHAFAQQRVNTVGLSDRVTVLLQDYRDLKGQYDKLVSIEMIEAVGHAFYDTYFKRCSDLLKPNGMMLLQAIIITDHLYEQAKHSVDFIQRYIFPGSCIPSLATMHQSLARVTDLRLFHLEDITPHYAETLRYWRERFLANLSRVQALGYPEEFIRMWEFYLCYCEGGFRERVIGDVQMLLTKPLCRREPILPALSCV